MPLPEEVKYTNIKKFVNLWYLSDVEAEFLVDLVNACRLQRARWATSRCPT